MLDDLVHFNLCTPNAVDETLVVARDKNANLAVIFNKTIKPDDCQPASATRNGVGEAEIEISLNGNPFYGKPYIQDGENVNVF